MMMKFARKTLALVLALSLLLCAAFAETAETAAEAQVVQNSNPVLATVNGEPIYKSECDDMISHYAQQYGEAMSYAQAIQQIEINRVLELVMKEEGYLEFTEEEVAKMRDEVQALWDNSVEQYVSYYLSEDTEEARAELRKQAEETLYASGYSVDSALENQKLIRGQERLINALVPEEAVTEEMIQNTYDQLVAQLQSMVGDSASMREMFNLYYGIDYYRPSGYRNVTHILIKVDEALLKAYQDASENYNTLLTRFEAQKSAAEAPAEEAAATEEAPAEATETEAAPTEEAAAESTEALAEEAPAEPAEAEAAPTEEAAAETAEAEPAPAEEAAAEPAEEAVPEEPVTEEQLEEARLAMEAAKEAVLQSKKAELDDIETRLAAGEAFETLIAQYNEDTGLNPAVGYEVHRESIMLDWGPIFRDAAFSEEMAQPGDHSKPVVGSYGIHILYYLSDAPEGAVPMTADARSQIVESLRSQLINEALYNIYEEKLPELTITKDDAAIAALDGTNSDVTIDFEAEPAEGQPEASEAPAETEAPAEPAASKAPEAPAETEAPAAETEAEPAEQTEQQ